MRLQWTPLTLLSLAPTSVVLFVMKAEKAMLVLQMMETRPLVSTLRTRV